MKRWITALGVGLTLLASKPALAETFKVDPAHSSLGFTINHLGLTDISGRFTDFVGTIDYTPGKSGGHVEFTAQAKSVTTDVDARDKHLRSPDFFDVEKFSTLTFQSTKLQYLSDDRYQVEGNLTIHGVTKPLQTTVRLIGPKEAMGSPRIGFRTAFKIDRMDFQVGAGAGLSNPAMIGHEVHIEVKGEAASPAAKP